MLYRGIAHESFAAGLGERRAALIDAGPFAIPHLDSFGVVFVAGAWAFLPGHSSGFRPCSWPQWCSTATTEAHRIIG